MKKLTILLLLINASVFSFSANITWTNGNGTGIWNDAANWSAGIPGAADLAIFDGTSTANCLIDISIDVRGISMRTGYAGTVTQSLGNTIIIRDLDFFIAEGRFVGGDSDIDMVNGNFQIRGGEFISTSASLLFDVNFVVRDSGSFVHNNGTVIFNDGVDRNINVIERDTFFNFIINPIGNNDDLVIAGGDTIVIENKLTLNQGRFRNGVVEVMDTMEMNANYDDGNSQVYFTGPNNGQVLINADVGSHAYFINKETVNDTVFVKNNVGATIDWGRGGDRLAIVRGVLVLEEGANLDFTELEIRTNGVFVPSSGTTRLVGSWDNQGGKFINNNGSWIFDLNANRNYASTVVDTFMNLNFVATGDFQLIMAADDSIYIENKLELTNGRIQTGHLLVHDTAFLYATYDDATADLWFVGTKSSNFIIEAALGNFDVFIRKDNQIDSVFYQPLTGNSLTIGETDRDLTIQEGVLSFDLVDTVNLDYGDLIIQPGAELQASPGTLNYQGNWENQGGKFNNNNGNWIFDPIADNRSFITVQVDTFFNVEMAGLNNIRMNLAADDSIYVKNKLELTNGRLQNGHLLVEDTAVLYSTYDDATADLWFKGSTTSNFIIEAAQGNFDKFIVKDNPTDTVYYQPLSGNSLNIGETDRDLTIQRGVLSFSLVDTVDLDYGDLIILSEAELEATSGITNYQGTWNNVGGKFNANGGTWIWDNNGNRGYATTEIDTFFTLLYRPVAGNAALVMLSSDSVYIENRLDLNEGRIQSGQLLINDTAFLYSTYDDGSANLWFVGAATSNFFIESAVGDIDFFVRKESSTDTVFFQPFTGNNLNLGETDRDLTIQEGILSFDLVDNANLDFSDIIIQPGAQLQAAPINTNYQGNWNNQGGLFNANQGNWIWDNTGGNRTYASTVVDTFFNFNYNPGTDRVLTMAADDSIYVENKLELTNGRLQNGHLLVEDTAILYSTYDDATADLWFIGSTTSNFLIEAALGNFDVFITKDTPTDTVFFQPLTGNSLTIGETDRDLTIQEGILSFDLVDTVNLDYGDLIIQPGAQLQASPGTLNYQGNWNNQGGLFNANQGNWIWDNTGGNRTYVSTVVDTFFNFNYNPGNDRVLTMAANDSIYIENKLELTNGRVNTGHFLVLDTAFLYATYDDATADLWFVGDVTSNFIIEAAQGNFDKFIVKDNPTDTVFFQPLTGNSLTIGETDKDLTIQEGILSFDLVETANLDYSDIFIQAGAKLQASAGTTRYQGNWNNIAGGFDHNDGTWIYDLGGDRTYTSHQVDTFFRMIFQPPSGNSDLTITTGDAFAVEQALFLDESGILNGSVFVLDTLEINANYDNNGSADIFFTGSTDGTFISNSANGNHDIFINKSTPNFKVDFIDENGGELNSGNTATDLFVLEGRVEFPNNNPVNFNFSNLNLFDGGTFQAPFDTLNFIGNWNNNLGKFEANGGSFFYLNSGDRNFITTEVDTFFNFTYNPNGNRILNMGSVDTIRVINQVDLVNGRIRTGFISAIGDVTVRSTYDGDNLQASLQFVGPNPQTFDLTGGVAQMDGDIYFDKSIAEDVSLNSVLDIDRGGQAIHFNKGYLVTTQTNVLLVDGSHAMIGPSDSSFVKGPVAKRGNQTFTFPVGDTIYAPITISSISNGSALFRAEYFNNDPSEDTYDVSNLEAGLNNVSTNEYWLLDRLATTASCRVNLSWRPTSGVDVPAELTIARWSNSTMQWEDQGSSFTTGDANNGAITSPAINNFSPFTLASTSVNNPLPVTYKYFDAIKLQSSNLLEWVTLSEVNADYFDVEKTIDGKVWTPIGRVDANGNSNAEIKYQFTDFDIKSNIIYYRLKQVDFDGTTEYSEERSINRSIKNELELIIFPNPVSDGRVTVSIKNTVEESINVSILSIQGKLIYSQTTSSSQLQRLDLDVSNFSKGTYFIRIDKPSGITTKKLIII